MTRAYYYAIILFNYSYSVYNIEICVGNYKHTREMVIILTLTIVHSDQRAYTVIESIFLLLLLVCTL